MWQKVNGGYFRGDRARRERVRKVIFTGSVTYVLTYEAIWMKTRWSRYKRSAGFWNYRHWRKDIKWHYKMMTRGP